MALFVTESDLARTYDGGAYPDATDALEQYRRVTDYASRHPNKGSAAIASALELPRSRIRTWTDDGGAPDVARGIDTARKHGWLDLSYDDRKFTALNALVANVFSGGSIAESYYRPAFALNHRGDDSHVVDALELADVDYEIVTRDGRADEARPTTDGTVLGRVLVTLGAPVGSKTEGRLSLPAYLDDAPEHTRETFVYCYLENRATRDEGRNTLKFREERSKAYLESLAELIKSVADGPVTVSEKNIHISLEATENLGTVI